MTEHLKNILIGLFITCAVMLAVGLIFFLEPNVGDGKQILRVRFANVSGIAVGTRVTFAGKPVGEVALISEVPDARDMTTDETGRVFLYELALKLDSKATIYKTDEIAIRTTGLMGERSIAIIPKKAENRKEVQPGEVLFANSVDLLEYGVTQVAKTSARLQTTIEHLDEWFVKNENSLGSAVRSFDQSMEQLQNVLGGVSDEKLVPALRDSVDLLSENLHLLRSALMDDGLLHKTAGLVENLNKTIGYLNTEGAQILRNANQISHDIANGTGTVGRLINSEDFYLRLASVMGKVETLMNDINHYGVLFQYDKTWQRGRTKRANQLQALQTPNEFKAFFEGEVDTIQTALGRLTELLERAGSTSERERIVQSENFKQQFGTLFRQAQALTDTLKLYNEELMGRETP